MKIVKSTILMTLLFAGVFSGCGGGQGNSTITTNTSTVVAYQFSATIDSYNNTEAPFPAAVGDVITGTFSYDSSTAVQKAPAGVQVKMGVITLNSDLSSFNRPIAIFNDLQNFPQRNGSSSPIISDVFQWITNDTQVAAQYGLDFIQTVIELEDQTATAFSTASLPTSLNLNAFTTRTVSLYKQPHGGVSAYFGRAQITSLTRVQ